MEPFVNLIDFGYKKIFDFQALSIAFRVQLLLKQGQRACERSRKYSH